MSGSSGSTVFIGARVCAFNINLYAKLYEEVVQNYIHTHTYMCLCKARHF